MMFNDINNEMGDVTKLFNKEIEELIKNEGLIQEKDKVSQIKEKSLTTPQIKKKLEEIDLKLLNLDTNSRLNDYTHFTESQSNRGLFGFYKSVNVKSEKTAKERIQLNSELLSSVVRATPNSIDCPRTVALNYLINYYTLKRSDKEDLTGEFIQVEVNEMDKLIQRLEFALEISKEIDALQSKKNLIGEDKDFSQLEKKIQGKISNLKEGEKMLLPGGWFDAENFHDSLYEISKTGDTFTVKLISLDPELEPYFAKGKIEKKDKMKLAPFLVFENVALNDLKSAISPLLQIQLPQIFQKEEESKSWLSERLDAVKKMVMGDTSLQEKLDLTPLLIMSTYFKKPTKTPSIDIQKDMSWMVSKEKRPSTVRTFMSYIKIHNPEEFQRLKFELEAKTFLDVIETSKDLLYDDDFRSLIEDSARRILKQLNTIEIPPKIKKSLLERTISALELVHEYSSKHTVQDLGDWKFTPNSVQGTLNQALNVEEYEPAKSGSVTSEPIVLKKLGFKNIKSETPEDFKPSLQVLKEQVALCQKLYNQGNIESMELLALNIIQQLPSPNTYEWKLIKLCSLQDKDLNLNHNLYILGQSLFEAYLKIQPSKASSSTLLALGKVLALSDSPSAVDPDISKFYMDPSPVLDLIKNDNYFRLLDADQQKDAISLISYYDGQENTRSKIRLNDYAKLQGAIRRYNKQDTSKPSDELSKIADNDLKCILQIMGNSNAPVNQIWNEKSEAVFPQILHEHRQLHLFMNIMAKQGHHLAYGDPKKVLSLGSQMISEAGGTAQGLDQAKLWQRFFNVQDREVQSNLSQLTPMGKKDRPFTEIIFDSYQIKVGTSEIKYDPKVFDHWNKWHKNTEFFREDGKFIDEKTNDIINFHLSTENKLDGSTLTQQGVMKSDDQLDIKKLRSIQSDEKQLEQTVMTFMQHPEYFQNPSYFRLFELNVFATGKLLEKMKEQPEFAIGFAKFLNEQYILAFNKSEISKSLVFLNLSQRFTGYTELSEINNLLKQEVIKNLPNHEQYEKLLKKCTSDSEKKQVFSSQLSNLYKLFEADKIKITDELLRYIAAGYFVIGSLPTEKSKRDPVEEKKIQMLLCSIESEFAKLLKDENSKKELVKTILDALKIKFPENEAIKGEFPQITIGELRIDFRKGLVLSNGKAQGLLPEEISQNPQFIQLFGKNSNLNCQIEFHIHPTTKEEITILTPSANTNIRFVRKQGEPWIIQQKMGGKSSRFFGLMKSEENWYQLLPDADATSRTTTDSKNKKDIFPPPLADIFEPNLVWRQTTDSNALFVTDRKGKSILYKATFQGQKTNSTVTVERLSDGMQLLSPWSTPKNILGQILSLESSQHILIWGKDDIPKEVQYPRIIMGDGNPLTYQVDYKKEKGKEIPILSSEKQFQGYELELNRPSYDSLTEIQRSKEEKTYLMDVLPFSFDQYQLLTKAGSPPKVIIPIEELKRTNPDERSPLIGEERFSKWLNKGWFERKNDEISAQPVLVYDVDLQGRKLKTESKEACAMLAYIFFAHKNYEAAYDLLARSETALAMKNNQKMIYSWIQKWPDNTPEGNAFKLKTMLLLEDYKTTTGDNFLSFENELMTLSLLTKTKERYDAQSNELSPSLLLTSKELETYKKTIQKSYIQIFPEKQKIEPISIFEIEEYKQPELQISTESIVQPEPQAIQMWMEVGANQDISAHEDFSLRGDKMLKEGFQLLYEKIYNCDTNSEEFQTYEKNLLLASPSDPISQGNKAYLLALIKAKRTIQNPDMLSLLKFPKEWNESRGYFDSFYYKRAYSVSPDHPAVSSLINLYSALTPFIESVSKKDELKKHEVDPLKEMIGERELDLTKETVQLKEKGQRNIQEAEVIVKESKANTTQTIIEELEKAKKLDLLREDRRVASLDQDKKNLENYLEKNPLPKPSTLKKSPSLEGLAILEFSTKKKEKWSYESVFKRVQTTIKTDISQLKQFSIGKGVAEETKRLANGFLEDTQYFIDNNTEDTITINSSELKNAKVKLKEDYTNQKKQLLNVEKFIIDTFLAGSDVSKLILSPKLSTVSNRLIGLYVQGKIADIKNIYSMSTFSDKTIKELEESIEQFMLLSTEVRLMKNALDMAEKFPEDTSKISSETATEFYNLLSTKRYYDDKHPAYRKLLGIEFSSGHILRKNQAETIAALLDGNNQVKQLGMGLGKSSILLPELLNHYADGTWMALGLIPEWLYEIVSNDLDLNCQAYFGQKIYKFEFDRNTPLTNEWLLKQYVNLASSIQKRDAVITTKTYLLSFKDKYIEMQQELKYASQNNRKEIEDKLKLMADILLLFKERAKVIADEVDSILDVRQELNYALGAPDKLPPEKFKLGIEIFKKINAWSLSKNKELASFAEALLNNKQAGTSNDLKLNAQKQVAREYYNQFGKELKDISQEDFIKYILSSEDLKLETKDDIPLFMHKLKTNNEPLYKKIGLLRQYVGETFNSTFNLSNNAKYGRGKDGVKTVPYKASNTPSDAEFGDSFERITYYIQDYLQMGLTDQQINTFIAQQVKLIDLEIQEARIKDQVLELKDCPSFKRFHQLYPDIDLIQASKDPNVAKQLEQLINKNSHTKLDFLENWILPNIEMAATQVSANAFDLVDMVAEFNGFTGTTWNLDTYHKKINTMNAFEKGTDGRSLEFLYDSYQKGNLAINIADIDPTKPLEGIMNAKDQKGEKVDFWARYDSVIDAGSYLKGTTNEEVADELVEDLDSLEKGATKKKAVVFVSSDTNEKVLRQGGNTTALKDRKDIKDDERISIYDEGHTIGTDIPHAQNARAAVTIGENMFLKDLLQAIWRMRKLRKGQQIDFIISKEVRDLIKTSRALDNKNKDNPLITIDDIINFCINNQAKREADDNLRAERARMSSIVPQKMFWEIIKLKHNKKPTAANDLFAECEKSLLKTIKDDFDAFAQISVKKTTTKVLENQRAKLFNNFGKIINNIARKNEAVAKELSEVNKLVSNYKILDANKLPEKIATGSSSSKDSQVQTQRQQQQQMSIQVSPKKGGVDLSATWSPWDAKTLDEIWSLSNSFGDLTVIDTKFDKNIKFTTNFAGNIKETSSSSLRKHLLSDQRIPAAQVLVMKNKKTNEWRAVLIDINDYEKVVAKCIQSSKDFEAAIYDVRPDKSILLRSSEKDNKEVWSKDTDVAKQKLMLSQIRFYSGQFNFFDQKERKEVTDWIGKDKKLKDLFEKELLPQNKVEQYSTSFLYNTFKK